MILEANGRAGLVAPSTAFGGYTAAFPKGSIENDMNRQVTAIFEAYEEAGLKV